MDLAVRTLDGDHRQVTGLPLDGGDGNAEAAERDRLFMLEAPFHGDARAVASLPLRYGGTFWSEDGYALVFETWFATRQVRAYVVDPDRPGAMRTLFDFSMENRYDDPGMPLSRLSEWGTNVLRTADGGVGRRIAGWTCT
jgi:hypothetical protein